MSDLDFLSDQEVVTVGGIKECMELLEGKVLARWQANWDNDVKGTGSYLISLVLGPMDMYAPVSVANISLQTMWAWASFLFKKKR